MNLDLLLACGLGAALLALRKLRRWIRQHSPQPYGEARFAGRAEIAARGMFAKGGILLGRYRGREIYLPGQGFVLVAAPTRSGKGAGIVIPNLLTFPGSILVLDIKEENFDVSAGYRRAIGQSVFLFNPFAADLRSHRYNPLDALGEDPLFWPGEILSIAQVFYPERGADSFWNDQARNLFLGLVLYLCETPGLPRSLGEVLRQASGNSRGLRDHLQGLMQRGSALRPLSAGCREALQRFLANGEATFAGILAAFNAPLLIFANPIVDAATSASDFSFFDLRRRPMTVYLGIAPNHLSDAARLLNLLFTQAIHTNTRVLPARDKGLCHQCLVLLDEFAALGPMPIIADAMPFLAGYNLRLLTIIQSVGQLAGLYVEATTRTLLANHAAVVAFAARELRDARELSEALGTVGAWTPTRGTSRSLRLGSWSRSAQSRLVARALLLPQELRELGTQRQLVLLSDCPPLLAEKIRYFEEEFFTRRIEAAPSIPRLALIPRSDRTLRD